LTFLAQAPLPPRELSPDQRLVLRNLVERQSQARSAAIFALGYYAGCRVSDIAWLLNEQVHLTTKAGWLHIGHKGGKSREIDLLNEVRSALLEYAQERGEAVKSPYFFTSQRSARLSEAGIHHWFRTLKTQARQGEEWEQIKDITFHDLRHDFAHRARAAGWSIEEVAYYLGHITKRGSPAIATTARYTQVSREGFKSKLKLLKI
jgi:integrase